MNVTDPPVAVRRIETDRQDVFAFEVTGHITAPDVENIYGLLEGAYALHDKIDVLVRVRDYDGVDWDAAIKDFRLLGKSHALRHVRRYAVVGGPAWMAAIIAVFNPFFRVEMKHFDAARGAEAWRWIGAREIQPRT